MSIVVTEDRGAVRHVVMNRPEKRNAMNDELIAGSPARCTTAAHDPSVLMRGRARRGRDVLLGHGLRRAGRAWRANPGGCASSAPASWTRGTCARR